MINIFSLSFGKDSMATLLLALEKGIKIDHVMYCDIRFSDEISGEHPVMAEWIPTAEQILKNKFNITVEHTFSMTYLDSFYHINVRGKRKGLYRGFPLILHAWCNSYLKINAINKYLRQFKGQEVTQFVGIAVDELKRWHRMKLKETKDNKFRSLLVEENIKEEQTFEICEKYGLLSPMYNTDENLYRGGCWFCPKQTMSDLYDLWKNHYNYFKLLIDLEKTPNRHKDNTFKIKCFSLIDMEKKFKSGYIPKQRKKRELIKQISIDEYLTQKEEQ